MKKKLPPLNWLRAFEASAKHLNFTHAADELNLTQAAISKQVKSLEQRLNATLFIRLPRGLELSEAGAAYLPAVREAIERLAATTDELFGYGRSDFLTIRSNLTFFTTWIAPRIASFRTQHPDINIRFTSTIWVDDNEIGQGSDLEIHYGRGDWPNAESDRLSWDHLFPVCSPSLLKNGPPLRTIEDLKQHTLLHVVGYEEGWGYWLNKVGCDTINADKGLQFDTLIAAFEMAAQGQGITLARSSLAAEHISKGRLIAPLSEQVVTDEAFYLICPGKPAENSSVEIFRRWLVAEAKIAANTSYLKVE